MKNLVLTVIGILTSVGIANIHAQEDLIKFGVDDTKHIPVGLKIGDLAPIIYDTAVNGNIINTAELVGKEEVVVIFYRGQWCPVCNRYLSNLSDSLEMIESKAKVILIGPESFENAQEESKMQDDKFTIIADAKGMYLSGFDVTFTVTDKYEKKIKTFLKTSIAENNEQQEAQLPVPATYVIGKDGKIKYRHFDYNYKVRATAKEILGALE